MNKLKQLCKGKFFSSGLVASLAVTVVCVYGIINIDVLLGLIFLIPINICTCGMILTRTAMIDAEIKDKEIKQDNKFDVNKIPSYMLANDREGLSMDDVDIYTVSAEAMGVSQLPGAEQKNGINVINNHQKVKTKVRKRTRNDFN